MKHIVLSLETLACPTCMQKIEKAVQNVKGVDKDSVKVLFNASKVKALFDPELTEADHIRQAIVKAGYQVVQIRVQ